jgi:hypothetical protein
MQKEGLLKQERGGTYLYYKKIEIEKVPAKKEKI